MNKATLDLIKHFESLHDGDLKKIGLQPKMDSVSIWTEGYGRAMIDPRTKQFLKGIKNKAYAESLQTIRTEIEADIALNEDLSKYATYAANALGEVWSLLNENQRGALTSFVYNCGVGKPPYKIFANIRKYNTGAMTKAQLIAYWETSVIKGGGVVLKGLVRRRKAEAKLFFTTPL
jgi:lysozyme